MKTYWNTQGGLSHLDEWQPNCWIQVTCPTEEDQRELEEVQHPRLLHVGHQRYRRACPL